MEQNKLPKEFSTQKKYVRKLNYVQICKNVHKKKICSKNYVSDFFKIILVVFKTQFYELPAILF